jgi:hypothetical protein
VAGRRRPLGSGALVAAVALVGAGIGPAAAEGPTQLLPGITVNALTVDLDGDGDREIVRLTQEGSAPDYDIDAWEYDGAGWSMIGSAEVSRGGEYQGALTSGGDAVGLLSARLAGRERVLVLSAALAPGDPNGATCCMRVSELQLTGDDLGLRRLQDVDSGAQSIWAADVDGDGSDDLVLHESRYAETEEEQTATLQVLRWTGTAFEPAFERTDRQLLYGISVGNSDGVAGEDLLFGPGTDGMIRRLSWSGDEMRLDEVQDELADAWIVGIADGAIVFSRGSELGVMRWPRDRAATIIERSGSPSIAGIGLVGDGSDALVVVLGDSSFRPGEPSTVAIHDLGLQLLGEVSLGAASEVMQRVADLQGGRSGRSIYPYGGPIPGGLLGGRAAWVWNGIMIQPGGSDGYVAQPIASLNGVQPVGLAGPQDSWVALSSNYSPGPGMTWLTWGGIGPESGRMSVTPVDQLLQPEDQATGVTVELVDAVEIGRQGEVATLAAEGDGFQVAIAAPPDSLAVVVNGLFVDEQNVGDEPLIVDIKPERRGKDDENQAFEAVLLVVTPWGQGLTEQWAGTFIRELPEIGATASTDAMALSATLSGHASPGSAVDADGLSIETDRDGRFSASIDAPIWPSRVVVTARDPLGHEATTVVEVLGLVDYRGLPWAAILIAITLLAGAVLYVRTPMRREASVPAGDARLEELELDAVDGSEPAGR